MSEKRFHPALKTLEQLEHTYLPRIANYRFSKQMKASIPRRREEIKEASMSELKDFLENIRKFSPKIGEMAMRNTAVKLNMDPSGTTNHEQVRIYMSNLCTNLRLDWDFLVKFNLIAMFQVFQQYGGMVFNPDCTKSDK